MVPEQERNKNSSIKTRDNLHLLSYDRETTVSRRRQKESACRVIISLQGQKLRKYGRSKRVLRPVRV